MLVWRLNEELRVHDVSRIERSELIAQRIAGILLLILAIYVAFEAVRRLLGFGGHPDKSLIGVGLTVVALIVMIFLARAKFRLASTLNSKALRTDGIETSCCAWLSLTTLVGLAVNAAFGWWWADPVAALILVPLIAKEGLEAVKGEECACHGGCSGAQ